MLAPYSRNLSYTDLCSFSIVIYCVILCLLSMIWTYAVIISSKISMPVDSVTLKALIRPAACICMTVNCGTTLYISMVTCQNLITTVF